MRLRPELNYLNYPKGLKSWLLTHDHKRIGVMYLVALMFFFAVGGLLAMVLRMELMSPERVLMSADMYNRLFTLHGAIMIFLFIIPSIPAALGNFVLPMMIGAKDVAFPRLNLASWYIYILGALFAVWSIVLGGVDTGWTFYTPYSTESNTAVIPLVTAVFILGFSSIFTGLNFIVTIHKLRAPGMTWFQMPLMVWGLYATAIVQVLATPVIGITLVLLVAERMFGIGIFDPAMGGDPVLFQHFFWFYSHPVVYVMILPGMGIISELISTFSHKKIFGYKAIAFSSLGIAFIGFLVWGHHMYVSGQSEYAALIFSFLTFIVGVPSGIKIFNWLATMYRGQISLKTPMLYALSFMVLFTIGGLTGIFLGSVSTDVHLHDTYFIVAHFHYTMMGGAVMAMLGGIHYWWPKMFGRMYSEFWGKLTAVVIFISFNLTFIPQFLMGTWGMPRRYYSYPEMFTSLNGLSSLGAFALGLGFLSMFIYLIHSLYRGEQAGPNPWGSLTMEWETSSPPIPFNFETDMKLVHGPYDYDKIEVEEEEYPA